MESKKVLKSVKKNIAVKITEERDAKEFFKDGKGLWVGSGFIERVVSKAETIKPAMHKLSSFELVRYAYDKEIEKELPKKHLFNESEVCGVIAEMISNQSDGKDGILLNNGNWNLFYLADDRVVRVFWYAGLGPWYVSAWQRGGSVWFAGVRVFSPQLTLKLS